MQVFCTSIPKSGSHFLERAFAGMGLQPSKVDKGEGFRLSLTKLAEALDTAEENTYVYGHWRAINEVVELVRGANFKALLLIRDPRDICLSLADFLQSGRPSQIHAKCPQLASHSWKELVIATIRGLDLPNYNIQTARQTCSNWMPWRDQGAVILRYEQLVRSVVTQNAIVAVEEIGLDPGFFLTALSSVFGSSRSATFNKAALERWRTEFDSEMISAWNNHARGVATELGYPECS